MSKHPLSWHRECLTNLTASLERKVAEVKSRQVDADRLAVLVSRLDAQINEATLRGLDGFDSDRFMAPRTRKVQYTGTDCGSAYSDFDPDARP